MNSKERVIASLEFKSSDRVPRDLWTLPAVLLFEQDKYNQVIAKYPMDIFKAEVNPGSDPARIKATQNTGTYVDEWGSVWQVGEPGVVGEVIEPVLKDWSKLGSYKPPFKELENRDYSEINSTCKKTDKFVLSGVTARPFERLQFLRGTENVFMDLAYGNLKLEKLLNMVHEYYLQDIRKWCQTDVDGIFLMDDWGTNLSLLISPEMWRNVFKPLYKEYCDMIHRAGKYVFFHSDGNIEQIYGDFIEVGIDAINSQLFCMNIEALAEKYKGKITFWGEIDRQHVLAFGSQQEIKEAVERIRKAFYNCTGGIIAQCEWGKGNSIENIEAVFETWQGNRDS